MKKLHISLLLMLFIPIWCLSYVELAPDLEDKMLTSSSDELIPITIRLTEQLTEMERDSLTAGLDKDGSRLVIINRLKEMAENTQGPLLDLLYTLETEGEVKNIKPLWVANIVACNATSNAILQIEGLSSIAYIGYDQPVNALCEIVWGIDLVNAPDVWNLSPTGYTGAGVVTAVQDTGCYISHTDIQDHLWINDDEIPSNGIDDDSNGYIDDYNGYDFYHDDGTLDDYYGHGTHVSGTVCGDGTGGSETGMAPDANLMVCESLGGSEADEWEVYQYELDNGADVVNCSFGWIYYWYPDRVSWRQTIENCVAGGLWFVIAAGNERDDGIPAPLCVRTPGDVPDVICVAATSPDDYYCYFSSFGPVEWDEAPPYDDYPYPPGLDKPDISAPGGKRYYGDPEADKIKSTQNYGGYTYMHGTSMASPHVCGAVALLIEADPLATYDDIKDALYNTAIDLGASGYDHDYGWGRLDILEAVNYLIGNTEIKVLYFIAEHKGDDALLSWDIYTDEDIAGFNILRADIRKDTTFTKNPGADDFYQINDSLITGGGSYKYLDTDIAEKTEYLYKLEAVLNTTEKIVGVANLQPQYTLLPSSITSIYPNPVLDTATVNFITSGDTNVEFVVYDISGRVVSTIENGDYADGEHKTSFDTDNFTNGVYIMRMITDESSSTKSFVVSK